MSSKPLEQSKNYSIWNLSSEVLPPYGQKVLVWHRGDVWVAMRMDEIWVPAPFSDSKFCDLYLQPEKWQWINFPEGYYGINYILSAEDNESLNWERGREKYPKLFEVMKQSIIDDSFSNGKWVSSEDRLPPEAGYYLAAVDWAGRVDKIEFDGVDRWNCLFKITHWMPLPEAPE